MACMKITEWEVIQHGIEYADYFQGCGTTCTRFNHVVTGIGMTELEALEDAIECLASNQSWQDNVLDSLRQEVLLMHPDISIDDEIVNCDNEGIDTPWWHISIRFNM